MIVTLVIISVIVFLMFSVIPGNPARLMLGVEATNEQVAALEHDLGLDRPAPERFVSYFGGLLTGNMGTSIRFGKPVSELIAEAAPVTLSLAFMAFLLVILLAFPLGILASRRPGGLVDTVIHVITEVTLAIPHFFMAILLILIFRIADTALGNASFESASNDLGRFLTALILPAVAIALSRLAMALEFLRDSLVEQQKQDYVRTARAKGVGEARILFAHVLRNSLVPAVTALGLILAEVVGGSVIIEQVFMLPGMGRLLVTAVEARDFPLAEGIILYIATLVVLVSFLVDLLNQFIDPRLRLTGWRRRKKA